MREGEVILTPIPQANGVIKNRSAVCLREMPPYGDLLVCGISTQLHQQVKGFDETITSGDADFAGSGLLADSLVRLGFLTVLSRRNIVGSIGAISHERQERLLKTLSTHLTANVGGRTP
jgi:mRNA interferase MazF